MHPDDAAARGLEDGDVGADLQRPRRGALPAARSTPSIRPGTVSLPKGLWRRSTRNGATGTALVPDTLTDLGGGACFNDARVAGRLARERLRRVQTGAALRNRQAGSFQTRHQ